MASSLLLWRAMIYLNKKGSCEGLEAIASNILKHLIKNPEEKDDIEGIIKYWPQEGVVKRKEKDVQGALNILVARGWVREIKNSSPKKIYEVNNNNLKAIKGFLNRNNDR